MNGQPLTIPSIESLKAEIEARRHSRLSGKISSYPRKNPILSDIGDCDRQICYSIKNWQIKPLPSVDLQARFEVGHVMEREMVREILDLGFDFVGAQDAVEIRGRGNTLLATGRIDGFIIYKGEKVPVEIKSMHPNIFDQVESIEDFQKKPWLRKYIRQLMMYCYGHNKEYGLFALTNCLGARKWFILYLDMGECELILQRLEKIHTHLSNDTLPDRIEYRDDVCGKCDFASICLKDVVRSEADILTDDVLIADLERRESLKDTATEYGKIDKEIKKRLKGIEKGVAGPFYITGKNVHRDAYEVEPSDFWQTSIKKL